MLSLEDTARANLTVGNSLHARYIQGRQGRQRSRRKEWYKLAIHRLSTITQVEMDNKMAKITEGRHECVKEELGYGEGRGSSLIG
jgi:hypothetical protein